MTGMSSNEQDNQEKEFGANPFSAFFMGGFGKQKEDFRSFEEIMKEFDEFFNMEKAQNLGDLYKNKGFVKGKDIEVDVDLEFDEAFSGAKRQVEYSCNVLCKTCNATGIKPGEKEIMC